MENKLIWIDAVKAISMLGVYVIHCMAYYRMYDLNIFISPFYVNAFFFVSGYLLLRKQVCAEKPDYKKAFANILFRIVIPTIIFSALIYLPKLFFHSRQISLSQFIIDIFGGVSFWFTSALVISQMILLGFIWFSKKATTTRYRQLFIILFLSLLIFAAIIPINNQIGSNTAMQAFPWYYRTGIAYTFIMALGGLYWLYEKHCRFISSGIGCIALTIIYAVSVICLNPDVVMLGMSGCINWYGGLLIAIGILWIIAICKNLKKWRFLTFISRNSIIFYFFSGLFPALFGAIIPNSFGIFGYIVVLTGAVISASISVMIINKWLPFLIDLRKIKH